MHYFLYYYTVDEGTMAFLKEQWEFQKSCYIFLKDQPLKNMQRDSKVSHDKGLYLFICFGGLCMLNCKKSVICEGNPWFFDL